MIGEEVTAKREVKVERKVKEEENFLRKIN
jgi:hypothetical protein